MLGSNLSIFNKPGRSLAQRRASRVSSKQISNISLAKSDDKSPEIKNGQMFLFDRNFSFDAELAKSETNINRVETPPIPDQEEYMSSPKVGRLWRRMSEPVNDLPKQRIKKRTPVYVRQQSAQTAAINNANNKLLLDKVEMLNSFTQDTMNAFKQEQERGSGVACKKDPNHDSAELLKILDETHQQFRNNILKAANAGRQGSIGSIGNRDSPAQSDYDTDTEMKPRRLEPAKKVSEMKKLPEIKKIQEKASLSDEMLFLKIDHSAESHDNEQANLLEDKEIHPAIPTITTTPPAGLELRESRSTPMLLDLNPIKELEIIEEQNEQDNQSDCGEGASLLEDENKSGTDQANSKLA